MQLLDSSQVEPLLVHSSLNIKLNSIVAEFNYITAARARIPRPITYNVNQKALRACQLRPSPEHQICHTNCVQLSQSTGRYKQAEQHFKVRLQLTEDNGVC